MTLVNRFVLFPWNNFAKSSRRLHPSVFSISPNIIRYMYVPQARAEDELLAKLASTRRLIGTISYRLLCSRQTSQIKEGNSVVVAAVPPNTQIENRHSVETAIASEDLTEIAIASEDLASLRASLEHPQQKQEGKSTGICSEARADSPVETKGEAINSNGDIFFIHMIAAEVVLSGLRGISLRDQPMRQARLVQEFQILVNGDLDWSSVAIVTDFMVPEACAPKTSKVTPK